MSTLTMTPKGRLPAWADELRRRYLRGESSQFVLHGNVHDLILDEGDGDRRRAAEERMMSISDFLYKVLLEKKSLIALYNLSTGVRFVKGKVPAGCEDLLLTKEPAKVRGTSTEGDNV